MAKYTDYADSNKYSMYIGFNSLFEMRNVGGTSLENFALSFNSLFEMRKVVEDFEPKLGKLEFQFSV